MIEIRKAQPGDHDEIGNIIREVVSKGDTYAFYPDSSKEKLLGYWCGQDKHCYVACEDGRVLGTFIIKDNQPDLGSHIANASYMVSEKASGRGIGKMMGEFSIEEARRLGYRAMQFNLVIKTNVRAVELWKKLGFEIIGEIPEAFRHKKGFVNAYIMYRRL